MTAASLFTLAGLTAAAFTAPAAFGAVVVFVFIGGLVLSALSTLGGPK